MNNKNKEQNIELLELKHMGVTRAKLEREKKATPLGQTGPESLGHKPKYSWQISVLQALYIQWEPSTKAQTTKHQPNCVSPSSPCFDVCFTSRSFANANVSKYFKTKRRVNLFPCIFIVIKIWQGLNQAPQDLKEKLLY